MNKTAYAAIVAACYFLAPLAFYIGLKALGAFRGDLLTTNLLIYILMLFAFLIAFFLVFVWKSYLRALALIFSVSIIAMCDWYSGQDAIQRYLYMAEVLMTSDFDKKCFPPGGVLLNGDTLRVCSTHDFGDYAKWIVKINGSYPTERLIDDINSGKVVLVTGRDDFSNAPGIFRPNGVIGYPLLSDYYLFEVYLCGKGLLCGPLG